MEALKILSQEHFDLMVLDVMLPELDGISVCESVRLQKNPIPILILSAKNSSADRVLGLKMGADDYLNKPFNLEELLLRVEKLIKKNDQLSLKTNVPELYVFGKNKIDFNGLLAINSVGQEIQLTKKEAMLLKLLIDHKNEVVTREKILQAVWGYNVFPTTRTIDNFILNFRKYFEKDQKRPPWVWEHSQVPATTWARDGSRRYAACPNLGRSEATSQSQWYGTLNTGLADCHQCYRRPCKQGSYGATRTGLICRHTCHSDRPEPFEGAPWSQSALPHACWCAMRSWHA
jgi:two-component system alkaline phosphatase synthesis response regulator PhoP